MPSDGLDGGAGGTFAPGGGACGGGGGMARPCAGALLREPVAPPKVGAGGAMPCAHAVPL